jgi:hypothetical protein
MTLRSHLKARRGSCRRYALPTAFAQNHAARSFGGAAGRRGGAGLQTCLLTQLSSLGVLAQLVVAQLEAEYDMMSVDAPYGPLAAALAKSLGEDPRRIRCAFDCTKASPP